MKKIQGFALAMTAASMFLIAPIVSAADTSNSVQVAHTAANSCKSQNGCKGMNGCQNNGSCKGMSQSKANKKCHCKKKTHRHHKRAVKKVVTPAAPATVAQ